MFDILLSIFAFVGLSVLTLGLISLGIIIVILIVSLIKEEFVHDN